MADRLKEIDERWKKATEGPHAALYVPSGMPTECCKYGIVGPDGLETARVWKQTDVEFYAHSREDIPWLLEQLAAAQRAERDAVTALRLCLPFVERAKSNAERGSYDAWEALCKVCE